MTNIGSTRYPTLLPAGLGEFFLSSFLLLAVDVVLFLFACHCVQKYWRLALIPLVCARLLSLSYSFGFDGVEYICLALACSLKTIRERHKAFSAFCLLLSSL